MPRAPREGAERAADQGPHRSLERAHLPDSGGALWPRRTAAPTWRPTALGRPLVSGRSLMQVGGSVQPPLYLGSMPVNPKQQAWIPDQETLHNHSPQRRERGRQTVRSIVEAAADLLELHDRRGARTTDLRPRCGTKCGRDERQDARGGRRPGGVPERATLAATDVLAERASAGICERGARRA